MIGLTSPCAIGASFLAVLRSYQSMDADLQRIARRALEEIQAAGKNYRSQTEAGCYVR